MSKFVTQPSQDARPGGKCEFVGRGEQVKGGLEETGTPPAGDAGTEMGTIPVETTECDEPVKQREDGHQPIDIGHILGTERVPQTQVRFPITEAMLDFHPTAIQGKGKLGVGE